MRHANPAAKRADMSDHDRPLDDRGRRDAASAASFLLQGELLPELDGDPAAAPPFVPTEQPELDQPGF